MKTLFILILLTAFSLSFSLSSAELNGTWSYTDSFYYVFSTNNYVEFCYLNSDNLKPYLYGTGAYYITNLYKKDYIICNYTNFFSFVDYLSDYSTTNRITYKSNYLKIRNLKFRRVK